jgi:hypothetical protein
MVRKYLYIKWSGGAFNRLDLVKLHKLLCQYAIELDGQYWTKPVVELLDSRERSQIRRGSFR